MLPAAAENDRNSRSEYLCNNAVIDYQIEPLSRRINAIQLHFREHAAAGPEEQEQAIQGAEGRFNREINEARSRCFAGEWAGLKNALGACLELGAAHEWKPFEVSWDGTPLFMNMLPSQTLVQEAPARVHNEDDDDFEPLQMARARSSEGVSSSASRGRHNVEAAASWD
jgi:hypothetical protein